MTSNSDNPSSEPIDLFTKPKDYVEPIKYSHFGKTSRTLVDALADDPVARYRRETPDDDGNHNVPWKIFLTMLLYQMVLFVWKKMKIVKTVDGGMAVVVITPAERSEFVVAKGVLDRLLDFFVNKLRQGADNLLTAQQQERRRETTAALDAFKQQKLGDRIKDLQYVEIICTAPECQGRGYGGALLKNIIAAAEQEGRGIWLVSTNIVNTKFYNKHGFQIIDSYAAGKDNPDWHEPPVVVNLMIREPTSLVSPSEKRLY